MAAGSLNPESRGENGERIKKSLQWLSVLVSKSHFQSGIFGQFTSGFYEDVSHVSAIVPGVCVCA